jgi:aconitate hydratase
VCLVSPETAAASALTGVITDPRTLEGNYPQVSEPDDPVLRMDLLQKPLPADEAARVELEKGPNIASLPEFEELPDELDLPVLLKVGDGISTDEILPAGSRVLPYRSNIPKIAEFAFEMVDGSYARRAREAQEQGEPGHVVVGGRNYGQGSSREHAALAPRFLGLRAVIAKTFARIHWQNLVNFGVLPLTFETAEDYARIEKGDRLRLTDLRNVGERRTFTVQNASQKNEFTVSHDLSPRQIDVLRAGGLINWVRAQRGGHKP